MKLIVFPDVFHIGFPKRFNRSNVLPVVVEIVSVNTRDIKNNRTIITFSVDDGEANIICKAFVDSNLNNKIDAIGIAITSRLNNIYKEDLDSYMFVKDLVTRTEEAKRINIRNTISEEENLHG